MSFRTMLARKKETCEKFLRASEKNLVSIEQDRRNGALVATEEKYGMFLSLRLATMTANTLKLSLHFLRIKHTSTSTFTSTSTSHKIKKFTKF